MARLVGQGRRSKVNIKCQRTCFDITVTLGQSQDQRSGSRLGQGQISDEQRSILGAQLCQVQQRPIRVITSIRCFCLRVCNQWVNIYMYLNIYIIIHVIPVEKQDSIITNLVHFSFPSERKVSNFFFFFGKLPQNLVSRWGETKKIVATA